MEVKVTQADREAVEHSSLWMSSFEKSSLAADFARHRIASQAELIEALEKIARAQCTSVDGRSDDLTDSWHHLKSIAREALNKTQEKTQ